MRSRPPKLPAHDALDDVDTEELWPVPRPRVTIRAAYTAAPVHAGFDS